ncbi:MAG: epoxyqueuosine reductase [bacterium]|nr:MAG: epoxyqueuosine reductase [bacterium]
MNITSILLKKFAIENEADSVGIAPVERFNAAPDGHKPADILDGAKSVIVCAKRIPGSTLYGPATAYHQAMTVINFELDQLACKLAFFLEENKAKAIPVPSDEPYHHWEVENYYGRGDLSHKHAAQAAGLGKLGKNSLLITPQFGNLVNLVSVVTDVDLTPDPVLDWDPCPKNCTLCQKACPAGAIGDEQRVDQALCRKTMLLHLPKGNIIESCGTCRRVCQSSKNQLNHF